MVNFWIKFAFTNCLGSYLLLQRVAGLWPSAPGRVLIGVITGLLFATSFAGKMVYNVECQRMNAPGKDAPAKDPWPQANASLSVIYAQSLVVALYWLELPLLDHLHRLHSTESTAVHSMIMLAASFWAGPFGSLPLRSRPKHAWDNV